MQGYVDFRGSSDLDLEVVGSCGDGLEGIRLADALERSESRQRRFLLSVSPAPVFETAQPMTLVQLYRASPLGVVGATLLGGIYSAMFGMSAVYATEVTVSYTTQMLLLGAPLLPSGNVTLRGRSVFRNCYG